MTKPIPYTVSDYYDHRLNGWPILEFGHPVAVALYRGGTDPARDMAQQIVDALNARAALRKAGVE